MKVKSQILLLSLVLGLTAVQACDRGSPPLGTQEKAHPTQRAKGELVEKLKVEFPGWKLVELGDLPSEDRKLWLEAHPDEQPGLTSGQFRRKGEEVFAALLIPRDSSQNGFRLVAAIPQKSGFEFILLEKWDKPEPTLVISRVKPGEYLDAERGEAIKIVLDSIFLETPEAGGRLYYWSINRFKNIMIYE